MPDISPKMISLLMGNASVSAYVGTHCVEQCLLCCGVQGVADCAAVCGHGIEPPKCSDHLDLRTNGPRDRHRAFDDQSSNVLGDCHDHAESLVVDLPAVQLDAGLDDLPLQLL